MQQNDKSILKDQIEYYRARASEYDEWFLRVGRYDQGSTRNALWFAEVDEVQKALKNFSPKGNVLELACGTGWWTQQLAQYANHITAVDVVPEVIAINKSKVGANNVTFIQADIFNWQPDAHYDVVFFSFWLFHVPSSQFEHFWQRVDQSLKPHGRVFFIDSLKSEQQHKTFTVNNRKHSTSIRKLNDGQTFNIVKVFYEPEELAKRLKSLGWRVTLKHTSNYFLYGYGEFHE